MRGRRSPTNALPSFEVHVTTLKSDWMGWKCRIRVLGSLVRASVSEHFMWHRQHSGKALQSVGISLYFAYTNRGLDRLQGVCVLVSQKPAACSRPRFSSASFSISAPPDSLLFSLLPPHAFLLFPICYTSSFLTSRLPPLCHCFSL